MVSMQDKLRIIEDGIILTRYYLKKKPEKLTFLYKADTNQLIWIRSIGQLRPDGAVDLHEIKEVRRRDAIDKETKEFEKWPEGERYKNLCFSLHYGCQFVLSVLALQAQKQEELALVLDCLTYLIKTTKEANFLQKINWWLRKEFNEIRSRSDTITAVDIKKWLSKSFYRIRREKLTDLLKELSINPEGTLTFEQFSLFYHKLVFPHKVFSDYFSNYISETIGQLPIITEDNLAEFLTSENHDQSVEDHILISQQMQLTAGRPYLTPQEFIHYLFSSDNSIWDPKATTVYQDMNQPICNYFIASSHNTYLTGDQFKSNSSAEAYIQSLRMGARCIELDCWDGPDGMPHIFHGRTLTSKIKFVDVVKALKKYAWQFSEYPVILSIENHCCLSQQKKMAEVFRDVFGDELLTSPVDKYADRLPSPNQLKRKFILKHKKLTGESSTWKLSGDDETLELGDISQNDLSQSRNTGILYLQDTVNSEEWNPHFFVLTNTGLYFTDQIDIKERDDDDDNVSLAGEINGNIEDVPLELRHNFEPWFHGKLPDGRETSDRLLKQYSYLGNAAFLVRESETFKGSFTLSFWQHDKANHCRIKSKQEYGQNKYYLVDNLVFDSLYELIEYYKRNKLRSANFELSLREPVPKAPSHFCKEWYHDNLKRGDAEDMLSRIPKDGAFLIRRREATEGDGGDYAISFRAENKIKHCRITLDKAASQYLIGSATFESLCELVQYYQKHPLYRKMKLKYPVNQQLVDKCGQSDSNDVSIYGCGIYTLPNEVQSSTVQYRALYEYISQNPHELSFKRGDIITNVIQIPNNEWWKGDCREQIKKLFPKMYVEQIEDGLGSMQQGSINLSSTMKCEPRNPITASTSDSLQERKLYVMEMVEGGVAALRMAAANPLDFQEWVVHINKTTQLASNRDRINAVLEKKFQIAEELSDLVIYCRSTPYNPDGSGSYYEMTSFSEIKAEKVCTKRDSKGAQFLNFNLTRLSRVYPKGQRIDSSNYDPIPIWNFGAHMLALNYQTPDRAMQINQGRFTQNGLCGYILQPPCLNDQNYDPFEKKSLVGVEPMTISLLIIAGRHLFRKFKGIPSPFVEVEILGAYYEDCKKFKTEKKTQNALMPVWNEATDFDINNPDLAMIRFCVQDEDVFGDPYFLGHATIPVRCLRPGYRSIQLLNEYSEPLELASLLVKIDIVNPNESEYSSIYSTLSELREQKMHLQEKVTEAADSMTQDKLKQQLDLLNTRIDEQLDHRRKRTQPLAATPRSIKKESLKLVNQIVDLPKQGRRRGSSLMRSDSFENDYVNVP